MGVCETDQEPDSCPPYYAPPRPPPDDKDGDGPSPDNSPDPPGNNGGDSGNGWWPSKPGSWPNRPSGLWKLKKVRRGCDAAAPPPSSFSSDNYNDDEYVVAVLAEPKKAPALIQKGNTMEGEIEAEYAQIAPQRVVQDSFRDLHFAAWASAREEFVDTTSR